MLSIIQVIDTNLSNHYLVVLQLSLNMSMATPQQPSVKLNKRCKLSLTSMQVGTLPVLGTYSDQKN